MKHFLLQPAIMIYCLIAFFALAQTQAQCGTAESRWLGSSWTVPPDATRTVYFDATFTSTTSISACQVFIADGITVRFINNTTLFCINNLTVSLFPSTQLIFENGASLVQSNAAAVNSGKIDFNKAIKDTRTIYLTELKQPISIKF